MLKKLRVPLNIGEKAYFVSPLTKEGDELPFVILEDYKIVNGRIEWQMVTSTGAVISGRIKDQQSNPLYKDSWIAISIPVVLHFKTTGLAPDFIFCVPSMVNINKEGKFTK